MASTPAVELVAAPSEPLAQVRTLPRRALENRPFVAEIRDVASGASVRAPREQLIQSARRRELDIILVWRLDRRERSLLDLIGSLQEMNELGVGFVSLCEALDLTSASGRALDGMLAVFAEFERDICVIGSRPALRKREGAANHTDDRPQSDGMLKISGHFTVMG